MEKERKFNGNSSCSSEEVSKKIVEILNRSNPNTNDCISLNYIVTLMHNLKEKIADVQSRSKELISQTLQLEFGSELVCSDCDFDYSKKTLHIRIRNREDYPFSNMVCSFSLGKFSELDRFYIAESHYSNHFNFNKLYEILYLDLLFLYDNLFALLKLNDSWNKVISTENSPFSFVASLNGVNIFGEFDKCNFGISSQDYKMISDSFLVNEGIEGKEKQFFEKIFVKINECPEWSQSILYTMRANRLSEEQQRNDGLDESLEIAKKRLETERGSRGLEKISEKLSLYLNKKN